MINDYAEDLADALGLLIKAVGEHTIDAFEDRMVGEPLKTFESRPHTERIMRVIKRIEADAFKRGTEAQRDYALQNIREAFGHKA